MTFIHYYGDFTDIWFVSFPSAIGRCGPSCPWFCHTRGINDAFIDPHPYGSSRRERQIYIHPSLLLYKLIFDGMDSIAFAGL